MIDHLSHELKTPLAVLSASCGLLQKLAAAQQPDRARTIGDRLQRAIGRLVELQMEASDIAEQRQFKEKVLVTDLLRRCQDLLESVVDEHDAPAALAACVRSETRRDLRRRRRSSGRAAAARRLDSQGAGARCAGSFNTASYRWTWRSKQGPAVCLPEPILFKSFRGLLRNAIEATPDGGSIGVSVQDVDGNVRLEIRDSGVGIDPELQRQLFYGFVHAGSTDNYSSGRPYDFGAGGKGLDLQRIKLFSERHGFLLYFTSEVGVGSVFTLEFPPALLRPRDG